MDNSVILPGLAIANVQSDIMSARRPAGDGVLGWWWSDVEQAERWQAGPAEDWPDGRITIANAGMIRLRFQDQPNRRPFVSVRGAEAWVPMQCQMWFSYTDRPQAVDVAINRDPNPPHRHYGIGPVSDGSLASNGVHTEIALFASSPEGMPWSFEQIVFGFLDLTDQS